VADGPSIDAGGGASGGAAGGTAGGAAGGEAGAGGMAGSAGAAGGEAAAGGMAGSAGAAGGAQAPSPLSGRWSCSDTTGLSFTQPMGMNARTISETSNLAVMMAGAAIESTRSDAGPACVLRWAPTDAGANLLPGQTCQRQLMAGRVAFVATYTRGTLTPSGGTLLLSHDATFQGTSTVTGSPTPIAGTETVSATCSKAP
jgi:hypothetical protein